MDREVVWIVLVAVGLFVEVHGVFIECGTDRDVAKEGHDEELRIVVKGVVQVGSNGRVVGGIHIALDTFHAKVHRQFPPLEFVAFHHGCRLYV